MDPNVLHLVVAVALTLLFVVVTALIWSRAQVKTVFWWIGLALLPLGLYFLGLAPQVEGAVQTLTDWWNSLTFTPFQWAGIVLAGLSLLLIVGSRLIPSESRADRRAAREAKAAKSAPPSRPPAPVKRPPAAPQVTSGGAPAAKAGPQGPSTPSDFNDDEITQILKRRGIE